MAAPRGGKFWQNRAKLGREVLFASPDLLWEAACEYFDWCRRNPLIKKTFRGSDAKAIETPTERPFTLTGLCIYLNCSSAYFRSFKAGLKPGDELFLPVISRMEDTIQTQQTEGAIAGMFNASITARINGLADKRELDNRISIGKELADEQYE